MNISQLLQLERKKAQLQRKKQKLIKRALTKKKKQQINAEHDSVKKGYIEKTKLIKKKQIQVVHEKARTKIPVQIQDNASVSSYLINNSNYTKIYERTKKLINFDLQKIKKSLNALRAFADQKFEKVLHVKLFFGKEIDCGSVIRPFQLQLPAKMDVGINKQYPVPKAIIVVKSIKELQKSANYKNLTKFPISIMQLGEFAKQWRNDKDFKKKQSANRTLILCDWQVFKNKTKVMQSLLSKGFVVFPFDVKKVPYFVTQQHGDISYENYLKLMLENEYALVKSGSEHTIHLRLGKEHTVEQLCVNLTEAVVETVAKLIQRNKDKSGNSLTRLQVKTNTSINVILYEK